MNCQVYISYSVSKVIGTLMFGVLLFMLNYGDKHGKPQQVRIFYEHLNNHSIKKTKFISLSPKINNLLNLLINL